MKFVLSTLLLMLVLVVPFPARAGCCVFDSASIVMAINLQTATLTTALTTQTLSQNQLNALSTAQEAASGQTAEAELQRRMQEYLAKLVQNVYTVDKNRDTADGASRFARATVPDINDCPDSTQVLDDSYQMRAVLTLHNEMEDRTVGEGTQLDPNEQIALLAQAAEWTRKYAVLNPPDGIMTPEQTEAWNNLKLLLFPAPSLKRPSGLKEGTHKTQLYDIQSAVSREGYALSTLPWNMWVANRTPQIEYSALGKNSQAFQLNQFKMYVPEIRDGKFVVQADGTPAYTTITVDANSGKISYDAYLKYLRGKYDSSFFRGELDSKYVEGTQKEIALLLIENNRLLLDIRQYMEMMTLYASRGFASDINLSDNNFKRDVTSGHLSKD